MTQRYIALDIETANKDSSSICSIGLAKFDGGEIVDTFYELINPEADFDYYNTHVHGIKARDVKDKPTFDQIADRLYQFIGVDVLVAHNATFDMTGIATAFSKYKLAIPKNDYFCTLRMSQSLYGDTLKNYGLKDMCKYFSVDTKNHHNALSDAIMCGHVAHGITSANDMTFYEFAKAFGYNIGSLGRDKMVLSETERRRRDANSKRRSKGKDPYGKVVIDESLFDFDDSHVFYGKGVCFSGDLSDYSRNEAAQIVSNIGAKYNSSVLLSTNYLVVADGEYLAWQKGLHATSKIKKYEQRSGEGRDIVVLTEEEFAAMLEG